MWVRVFNSHLPDTMKILSPQRGREEIGKEKAVPQPFVGARFHPMGYTLPEPEVAQRILLRSQADSPPDDSMQSHTGQGTGIGGE